MDGGSSSGEQGDAPIGHSLQPEEVPEIRTKKGEKRGEDTCFGGIGEKYLSIAIWAFPKVSTIELQLLSRQEKSPVKSSYQSILCPIKGLCNGYCCWWALRSYILIVYLYLSPILLQLVIQPRLKILE
ncbi:hypothetical protein Murru_0746 [Allomuricauda ruestringensis DSM 13258]|uniref:Uncharacterized protein n=1 Tax=Allomuricauda ruestringensis (strain DSM 13258 / CIP 107369 / LMG 19739 / B1) TaxID=886377 RepID=G2PJN7_ALLRU|nr:hypothetical protein Murru_0746 [Allomuricauda ruestringensis DSM 13258]